MKKNGENINNKKKNQDEQVNKCNKVKLETHKTIERLSSMRYRLIVEGACVGALAGVVIVLFRLGIEKTEFVVNKYIYFAQNSVLMAGVWFLALFFISIVITTFVKKEPLISGSGIPQLKGELMGEIEAKWWRVLIAKFVGGILAIGGGMSLGREGPSIQLGAMVGKGFSRLTRKLKTEERHLMTCGAGAGLAAAFNAPFAGVIFSLEEIHKNFSEEVLLTTMSASITSDFVCRYVFGLKPVFTFENMKMLPLKYYIYVAAFGLVLGVLGVLFNLSISKMQDLYAKAHNQWIRILVPSMFVGIFGLFYPLVLGGGHSLVAELSTGHNLLVTMLILLLLKWIFTCICFGSGAPGGIFLPQLVVGAVVGAIFAYFCVHTFGIPVLFTKNFVTLGMVGFFASVVRAPVTGIILICEMTGSFSHLLTLSLVSLVAYITADFLNGKPIYDQLLERLLSKGHFEVSEKKKVLIETPVYYGSLADDTKVCDLEFPRGCLIVSIGRNGEEVVPNGNTIVKGGDKLIILCNERSVGKVDDILKDMCRTTEF